MYGQYLEKGVRDLCATVDDGNKETRELSDLIIRGETKSTHLRTRSRTFAFADVRRPISPRFAFCGQLWTPLCGQATCDK